MTETSNLKEKVSTVDATRLTDEVFTNQEKKLVKIQGILTSRIEVKPSTDIPAYGFFKLENREEDIPVIFRIKESKNCQFHSHCSPTCRHKQENWTKPSIKKGSLTQLTGEWKGSRESKRPSFTAYSYQIQLVKAQIETYQSKENHG